MNERWVRALPHTTGRWFFRANDDSGILWADGSEPFSETSQARFRAYAAAPGRRGYAIVTRVEERPQWFLDAMFSTGRWGGLMSQNPLSLTRGPGY